MNKLSLLLSLSLLFACKTSQNAPTTGITTMKPGQSEAPASNTSITDKIQGMDKYTGYFDFYWDSKSGKVFLQIDKFDQEFLYVNALAAGVGSNDIGLDRGQLGNKRIVKFVRSGPKVLMVQPNYSFRAISDNPAEAASVEQAFAQSVLWGFTIDSHDEWSVLVDATDFFMRDAHGVSNRLSGRKQGSYKLDKSRSAMYLPMTKNFPENSEFEATVTFTGNPAGAWIRSVTPSPDAVTVRMHHSFIQLPDDKYTKRKFDPRSGFYATSYYDYATPIDQPLVKKFINRHRLEKKDPNAAISEPVEPIIYYLDRGAPEPVKSALLDGAKWWDQAFEAAGYRNAFQVRVMPEDADPLDIRYNVIQWVHRSTRGWSYGASVADPRTGEIIKGHVSLGSLRVRQDFLIAEGLLSPYENGTEAPEEMKQMAVARLRQLSAHEVGHTIGLVHSYASNRSARASVMDYPHPLVKMGANGKIDLSEAYDVNIGEWDKIAIKYGYSDFADGVNEDKELEKILNEAFDQDIMHITDQDSRPTGSAHPHSHLWDNGESAADELNRMMDIRKQIVGNFSEKAIRKGMPMATIEEALVPMYLFHRFQVEAAAKVVGGLNYTYALRGDGQMVTEMVPAADQMMALDALIRTMSPDELALPESLLQKLPPRPFGYPRTRETFKSRTGLTFDPLAAAETAASLPAFFIFHPERAGRLVEYNARDAKQPGLSAVIDKVIAASFNASSKSGYLRQLQYIVNGQVLLHMIKLANDTRAHEQVRAITHAKIIEVQSIAGRKARSGSEQNKAHYNFMLAQIDSYLNGEMEMPQNQPLGPPDGSPIGSDWGDWFKYCSVIATEQ
ncbi:MAG: zinc-dependent metalloprotease [Cyclobacteriaceae bacterium]